MIDGIILKIDIVYSFDGNEHAFGVVTASPGRCEPGDPQKQKILPEPELKGSLPSKGTGVVSCYPAYSLQNDCELISRVPCHWHGIWVIPRRLHFHPSSLSWAEGFLLGRFNQEISVTE